MMKKSVLFLASIFSLFILSANTYYSTNNANPNATSSWHTSRAGTGSTPSNFTSGDIFIIQAGHTMTTTANWTITGTNSKLTIETGATLQADDKVAVPNFEIAGTGYYIHNKNTNSFPGSTTRTFAATSTVEIRDWSGGAALPDPTIWGNLIINLAGYGTNLNQAGNLTNVAGDLIIRNTGVTGNEFRLATTQNYTLTIGGDLVIENGTLEAGQNNGNDDQLIIINGDYIQSGGTFTRQNNNINVLEVQFNGTSSNFTKTGGTLTDTYMNWIVNASKKLTLNNDLPIALLRTLTVNGSIDCGTSKVSGLGIFNLTSTGKLITSSTAGVDGAIQVSGSTLFNTGSSFEFRTATSSPFPGVLGTVTATDIVIAADVTFNKDVSISGSLNLSSGKLTIPAGNTVTVTNGNTITGSGFSASKHIVMKVNTSTGAKSLLRVSSLIGTTTLPIGNGTYYLPVTLTTTAANDFSVGVFQGVTVNGTPNGTAFTTAQKKKIVDAVWIVNKNSGSGTVTMKLAWPSSLEGSSFPGLTDSDIGIAHFGGYWESPLGSGSQSLKTVTRTGITNFSPFGVGQIGTPLPLKFGSIKVYEKNDDLNVNWTTYSEVNVDHFEIERSQTGQQFSMIGRTNAIGGERKTEYNWIDSSPLSGNSYYRIKEVDIDNSSKYSSVVRVDLGQSNSDLTLFPNPVIEKKLSIQVGRIEKGQYKISVTNLNGKTIYDQLLDHGGGVISQGIQLAADTAPGMYSLSITGNGVRLFKQFVVK